jgi:hypothetical protein
MKSSFTITWFCKLGNRLLISDTEKGQKLKEKRDRRLQTKLKDRRAVLNSYTATFFSHAATIVMVNSRWPIFARRYNRLYAGSPTLDLIREKVSTWAGSFVKKHTDDLRAAFEEDTPDSKSFKAHVLYGFEGALEQYNLGVSMSGILMRREGFRIGWLGKRLL